MKKAGIVFFAGLLLIGIALYFISSQSDSISPGLESKILSLEKQKLEAFPKAGYTQHLALFEIDYADFRNKYIQIDPGCTNSPFTKDAAKRAFYLDCVLKNESVYSQAAQLNESLYYPYLSRYKGVKIRCYHSSSMENFMREKRFLMAFLMAEDKPFEAMDQYIEYLHLCGNTIGYSAMADWMACNMVLQFGPHINLLLLKSYDDIDAVNLLDRLNEQAQLFTDETFKYSNIGDILVFNKMMNVSSAENKAYVYFYLLKQLKADYKAYPEHYQKESTKQWFEGLNDQFHGVFKVYDKKNIETPFYRYLKNSENQQAIHAQLKIMVHSEPYFNKDIAFWPFKDQLLLEVESIVNLHLTPTESMGNPLGARIPNRIDQLQRHLDLLRLSLASRIYYEKNGMLPESPLVLIENKTVYPLLLNGETYDYVDVSSVKLPKEEVDQILLKNIFLKLPYLSFDYDPCYTIAYSSNLQKTIVTYQLKTPSDKLVSDRIAQTMLYYSDWFHRIDNGAKVSPQEYAFERSLNKLCLFAYGEDGDSDGGLKAIDQNLSGYSVQEVQDGDYIQPILFK